jgi:hypothetical protein
MYKVLWTLLCVVHIIVMLLLTYCFKVPRITEMKMYVIRLSKWPWLIDFTKIYGLSAR